MRWLSSRCERIRKRLQLHQAKHCIAAANGTLTLEAALRALDVGVSDEVIVPPYTFIATANAPRLVGVTPVFVDIEPDTYNLDAAAIETAISSKKGHHHCTLCRVSCRFRRTASTCRET